MALEGKKAAKGQKGTKSQKFVMCIQKKEKARHYFPILEWSSKDVEDFIKERNIKCAPVYYDEQGNFHVERRLGCMCCPLASKKKRIEQFKKYPNMVKAYIKYGDKYLKTHSNAREKWKDIYEWFVFYLFYWDNIQKWHDLNSGFLPPPNYKEFLENYFNIKFK